MPFGWKDIVVWFLQWVLIELGKRKPAWRDFIVAHAPAVVASVSVVVEIALKVFGIAAAHAAGADSTAITVIPLHPSGAFLDAVATNALGTVLMDNLVKKILWRYVVKRLLGGLLKKLS